MSYLVTRLAAICSVRRFRRDCANIVHRGRITDEESVVYGASMRCSLLLGKSLNRISAIAYDADGNQTLVTTGTGVWLVEYNGENRPVKWTRVSPDSSTPNSSTPTLVSMTFDHQGRRRLYVEVSAGVTNKLHRFTYDDYVCIARSREVDAQHGVGSDAFVWDPTEPIATRPLMCDLSGGGALLYCHDGNKNVSETISLYGTIAAHYEYSSFGKVVLVSSESEDQSTASLNPYRFSSEYADDATRLAYYNCRHYDAGEGRWLMRDPLEENGYPNLVVYVLNSPLSKVDYLGQQISMEKCNQLLDSLWDFTPSNMDIDILSMGISIEMWGCKNPKPTCVCTINGSNGSFHPGNNSIELNAYNLTVSGFRGTLLHELQHRYDSCIAGGNGPEDCHERAKWEVNAVLRSGKCKSAANSTTDWNCVKKRAKRSVDKHPNCAATSSADVDAYINQLKIRGWL